ncbi:Pectinesterase/pectinesterase inhibitor [Thalictrum thalictroides]|uniref:Pectinesterase/pectinesterase inhibitor n=1 Tax=Thalictrum thalictroides TaxID=46969 RepID=A0A7J6VC45_THATH|nr:Pectinesterase/pectinesterase inhibitor [Thalictrum thalictroides]
MFSLSIKSSIDQAHATRSLAYNVTQMTQTMLKSNSRSHLDDCVELLDQSLDQLSKIHMKSTSEDDIQTWLSAAITHQTFCLDGFENEKLSKEKATLDANLRNNIQHISNSLALHKSLVTEQANTLKGKGSRRLMSDDFPTWLSIKERKLLQTPVEELETSAKVALDGTGTHKTISEALAFVSLAGTGGGRKVIHVAAGTYSESSLGFSVKQSNVMLVGDGKGRTVITGSKSASGGSNTFSSASFAASGDGFIARDISFVNSAGRPWKTYSRTVVMQSYLDGIISAAGWYPWSGSSSLNTLYYGEYSNTGPGASTSGRVKWGGYHPSMSVAEASKFTVANLISGNSWLPSTGVIFDAGL